MSTWYPGVMSYWQWRQSESFKNDITKSIEVQSNELIANEQQTRHAITSRLDRIASINSRGFQNVTNAIEAFHADFNYKMGLVIQELEIQSDLLRNILNVLKNPLKTRIEELYRDGCNLIQESIFDKALQKFNSIILELDDTHFLTHYQLGQLYLNGKSEEENVINVEKANEHLILACRLGKGKAKANESFKPIVSNAMFYCSISFYFQLESSNINGDIIQQAIKYAENAIEYNSNLSQAHYHLGKYYSLTNQLAKMKARLESAILLDRNYAIDIVDEKAFENNKTQVNTLLGELKDRQDKIATYKVEECEDIYSALSKYNVTDTIFESQIDSYTNEYNELIEIYNTQSYFGYLDATKKSETLFQDGNNLLMEIQSYLETLKTEKDNADRNSLINAIKYGFFGGISGIFIGYIIGVAGCIVVTVKSNYDNGGSFLNNAVLYLLIGGAIFGAIMGYNDSYVTYNHLIQSKRKRQ